MRLRLHPSALAELDEAVGYLENERSGLGQRLFAEVRLRVGQAARLPTSGSPVSGFAERHDVRQFVVRRFPYLVVTALIGEERLVVAIAHTRREPGYWKTRVGP